MQQSAGLSRWRLVTLAQQQLQGVALVLKRALPGGYSWLYVPRGPVFAGSLPTAAVWLNLEKQLIQLAQTEAAMFVRVEPLWSAAQTQLLQRHQWRGAEHDVQPRHTLLLDLRQTASALLAAMHHKTRYNIRLAEKRGVQVRFSTAPADLETFIRLSYDVEERSVFRYHPPDYYRAMHNALSPSGLFAIAIAELAGTTLAAHILISFGDTVTYVHGASSSHERQSMAPHLLQWASIQWAQAAGKATYDFFGVAPPGAPSDHPWAGITRFKESFGGRRVSYLGAYDYVVQPQHYSAFTLARRLRRLWR